MKRSTLILAIIFLLEFLLLVILKNTGHIGLKRAEIQENYLALDSSAVAKIEINPLYGEATIIQLENEVWYITSPLRADANQTYIANAIETLSNLTVTNLISENKDKFNLFQVGDENSIKIKAYDSNDNLLTALIVGKKNIDFGCTYIRKLDDNKVYLAKGFLGNVLGKPLKNWRDKSLLNYDIDNIKGFLLEYPRDNKEIQIERKEDGWYITKPKTELANKEACNLYQITLATFKVSDFLTKEILEKELERADMETPKFRLTIFLNNGEEEIINFANREDNPARYIIEREGIEEHYITFENVMKNLMKEIDDFRVRELDTN